VSKPFKCNVCKLSYGQGATLDIHLRSVGHQSRLSRLGELVASGEVDPMKPTVEQPGVGTLGRLIGELVMRGDGEQVSADQ
jgi:AT-binding transcription factor 1